ncbi:MAG: T9SS type A sorting domain-containing protein [Bacteroidia bacterium]|nr:T9SS type A sorting domain-containing protein [Bacteroidia bacterium]
MKKIVVLFFLLGITSGTFLIGRNFRENQVPHGTVKSCLTCHVVPGGDRNAFGREIQRNFLTVSGAAGSVKWGPELAQLDSDGDGFTNGQELQDPTGSWTPGQAQPGDRSLVTNPGDPTDFPKTTSVETRVGLAAEYHLGTNYPNPFNPTTRIEFGVPLSGHVRLEIYSVGGALVRTLVNDVMQPGVYSATWNGRNNDGQLAATGLYLYRMSAGTFSAVKRMVMIQ